MVIFRSFTFRPHDKNISASESRDSGVPREGSRKRTGNSLNGSNSGFGGSSGISESDGVTPVSGAALVRRRLDLRWVFHF